MPQKMPNLTLLYHDSLVLIADLHTDFWIMIKYCGIAIAFAAIITLILRIPDMTSPEKPYWIKRAGSLLLFMSIVALQQGAKYTLSFELHPYLLFQTLSLFMVFMCFQLSMGFSMPLFYDRGEQLTWLMPFIWGQDLHYGSSVRWMQKWAAKIDAPIKSFEKSAIINFFMGLFGFIGILVLLMIAMIRMIPLQIIYLLSWLIIPLIGAILLFRNSFYLLWYNIVTIEDPLRFQTFFGVIFLIVLYLSLWHVLYYFFIDPEFDVRHEPRYRKGCKRFSVFFFMLAYFFYLLLLMPMLNELIQPIPLSDWLDMIVTGMIDDRFIRNVYYGLALFGNAFLAFHVILSEEKPLEEN